MPQQRSSAAVWIALALIAASIACVALSFKQIQAAPSPSGLSTGIYILFIAALIAPIYFTARLLFSGLMIVFGKPINRTVAWHSSTEALFHGALVLAVVIAAIVLGPPQGFTLVAIGLALALIALFLIGRYPNLAETQGWEVVEPRPSAVRPTTPSAPPKLVAPVVIAPVVAPPINVEAPRAPGTDDDRAPSVLR